MKIKRFIAANMREAMRMVREEQGDDAVILGNRRIEGGVEVVAATDYDAALVQQAASRAEPVVATPADPAAPVVAAAPRAAAPAPSFEQRLAAVAAAAAPATSPAAVPARVSAPSPEALAAAPVVRRNQASALRQLAPAPPAAARGEFDSLRSEMQDMRRFMEQQLGQMAWSDLKTRNPLRAEVVRRLSGLGVELKLAREIATELPDNTTPDRARYLPMALLARRLPTFKHEWVDEGGVIALVGATGVGKTTTIAKLAARYVQNWGMRDVALVTTDHYRIGAQEQLFTYGRLLGVPVLTADNHQELCLALDKLRDRKLVLIDTAGMSPRDGNLQQQLAMLSGLPVPNRSALVVSASSHASDIDAQFARFAPVDPSAVILSKVDESARLGAAISALVRRALPLAYITDGQRVPEDIACARADQLVLRAMQALRTTAELPDDDELSHQYAGAAHA